MSRLYKVLNNREQHVDNNDVEIQSSWTQALQGCDEMLAAKVLRVNISFIRGFCAF